MKFRDVLKAGEAVEIGSHHFSADAIIEFARKFDPQFFHVDAELAKSSIFGGLCASGWHVTAVMMKLNVAFLDRQASRIVAEGGEPPKLGPSPGFKNLKWLKPTFAGDTITYVMRFRGDRPVPNRPGRNIAEMTYEGTNQRGEVMFGIDCSIVEFD
jgi:acyl dehydratase